MSDYSSILQFLSWTFISGGTFFTVVGAIGTLRFPDFWARLHAASVTESAGVILLLAGLCLHAGWTLVTVKLIFIGVFLFITGPTSTHAIANAALVSGLLPKEQRAQSNKTDDEIS